MRTARVAVAAAWVLAAVVSPVMGYDYGWDPGKIQGYGIYMEVAQETFLPDVGWFGAWDYTIDCYTDGSYAPDFMVWGFNNAEILNFADGLGGWDPDYEHNIYQRWDGSAAGNNLYLNIMYGGPQHPQFDYASYALGSTWTVPGDRPYAIDNTAHPVGAYTNTAEVISCAYDVNAGASYTNTAGMAFTASEDGLHLEQWDVGAGTGHDAGLLWSLRVVVPALPLPTCWCPFSDGREYHDGDITWSVPDLLGGAGGLYPVLGMPDTPPENWPEVIDDLCDSIGGSGFYDMDGDSDVDEDDLVLVIEYYVEYDSNGDGISDGEGTKRGDFNLDGIVNATDLAIMKAHFGDSDVGWADGNGNCDDVVNATDLAILKNNFGFMAPTGAASVPEPACLALLALGVGAILGRRANRQE